ncbi:hypothetical protein ABH309_06570 [Chromobacterium piscinae]|uniref:Uncharacterized protein n=1 Tax=Chromobacterium piscinae TaxID=686831 RepID=A0ABV0H2T4_9NEIS
MAYSPPFSSLEIETLRQTIARVGETRRLTVLNEGIMPEADVLLCLYRNQRINIHVDLAYGASLHAIDPVNAQELLALKQWLLEHSLHSQDHES